jgi:glutaminyl-peptide cyclotransferase
VVDFQGGIVLKRGVLSRLAPSLALFLALAVQFFVPQNAASAAATLAWRKVGEAPHDASAFTQGLLLRGSRLYESIGLYGRSELRLIDPATGKVQRRRAVDSRLFAEGLALYKDVLYQLTWQEGKVLLYDADTLASKGELPLAGEGWGLTASQDELIRSDGSSTLYFHDPATFKVTRTVTVGDGGSPVSQLNELEYAAGMVLANIWHSDKIAVISPADGRVLAWLDMAAIRPASCPPGSEKVLNGIAYDPATGRLLLTGKFWPSLFVIEVDWGGLAHAPRRASAPKEVK